MDPKAALLEAINIYLDGDLATAAENLHSYANWRARGGFEPRVERSEIDAALKLPAEHSCCADHIAAWLTIQVKRDLDTKHGLKVERFDDKTMDLIWNTLSEH